VLKVRKHLAAKHYDIIIRESLCYKCKLIFLNTQILRPANWFLCWSSLFDAVMVKTDEIQQKIVFKKTELG